MSGAFDPYYKWLGIPPSEQPPNHYRLLGISPFEADLDVISNAADQRMVHIRTYQGGKHSALSQKILNEVSAARVCLLDPQKRSLYDEQLRQTLQPAAAPESVPPPPPAVPPPAPPVAPPAPPPPSAEHLVDSAEVAASTEKTQPAVKISAEDVARAEEELRAAQSACEQIRRQRQHERRRLALLTAEAAWLRLVGRLRPWADRGPAGRLGVAIIAAGACVALGIMGAGLITLHGAALLAGGVLGLTLGGAVTAHVLAIPPDPLLARWENSRREALGQCRSALRQLEGRASEGQRRCDEARQQHEKLVAALAAEKTPSQPQSGEGDCLPCKK